MYFDSDLLRKGRQKKKLRNKIAGGNSKELACEEVIKRVKRERNGVEPLCDEDGTGGVCTRRC